ncbi:MAG: hypothetical protein IPH77_16720 [Ignavibacteria bacterium]|nr:hypothetical protein [Ignavibacteria bacterium]
MKTFLISLLVVLLFSFSNLKQSSVQSYNNGSGKFSLPECPVPPTIAETINNDHMNEKQEKSPENIDQDWYGKAIKNIQDEEYAITYSKDLGEYQSPNRKNNIRFIYHKNGFTAKTRDVIPESQSKRSESENEWRIDFKAMDAGRDLQCGNENMQFTNYDFLNMDRSEIIASGNKAYIENENIRIDYTNVKEGMRQDFIIKKRPDGEGKLRLNITAVTKLKMIAGSDALMFKDENGIDKMKYSALKCWDANGRELRAYFEGQLQVTSYKFQVKRRKSKIFNPGSKIFCDSS